MTTINARKPQGVLNEDMGPPKRILVVDDDLDMLTGLKVSLLAWGYDVDGVTSGENAVSWLMRNDPDLVILDVNLPGMSGIDLCAQLRQQPRLQELPIIVLTGLQGPDIEERARAAGASAYLNKPLNLFRLHEVIDTIARSRPPSAPSSGLLATALPSPTVALAAAPPGPSESAPPAKPVEPEGEAS